jgi:hypothetical protein
VKVPDVLVIGSGISGAMMARGLLDAGATVAMIDPGADSQLRDRVPDLPFQELRRSDPNQRSYLIGDNFEGVPAPGVKVGAQLTPPRQHIQKGSDKLLPSESSTFFPLMPLAIGGLGASWGAACFTFEEEELRRMGLDPVQFAGYYQRAADLAGISADPESEANARLWRGVPRHQPPLDIDDNAQRILDRHRQNPTALHRRGMTLGRIPMAILSQDVSGDRRANPYFDTDFYGDVRKSIYRPAYVIHKLRERPEFSYLGRRLALRFEDRGDAVTVETRNLETDELERHEARRIVLCAGALNSARLALHSLGLEGVKSPILCNPYTYMPTVNLAMLGHEARDRRHSMAQLGGALEAVGVGDVYGCYQMYSYRSLLLFKLVKEMPLPPSLGLTVARVLQNSLAIFGIFFADEQQDSKFVSVRGGGAADQMPVAQFEYRQTEAEIRKQSKHESIFASALRSLHCIPIGKIDPGKAGSIHYAGTIPLENPFDRRFHANPDGTLEGARNVYLGDGAAWNFLPAKGLSFTLMANALRVADQLRAAS